MASIAHSSFVLQMRIVFKGSSLASDVLIFGNGARLYFSASSCATFAWRARSSFAKCHFLPVCVLSALMQMCAWGIPCRPFFRRSWLSSW